MAHPNIRAMLLRIVPVAVPVVFWGIDWTPEPGTEWAVPQKDGIQLLSGTIPLDRCQSLCGSDSVTHCYADDETGSGTIHCTSDSGNGFHNGTGCSCQSQTPDLARRVDLASPQDALCPVEDLAQYKQCTGTGDMQNCNYISPLPTPCFRITPSSSTTTANCGRRPPGLQTALECPSDHPRDAVGQYLAAMAHLEAASVSAFRIIERELRLHGAPDSLIRAARGATHDEIRHARTFSRLARLRGASIPKVKLAPSEPRSLEELALDNLKEGCIGETYGAAVALFQSRFAQEATLRDAFAHIAEEEIQHAEFSWELDAWLRTQLAPASICKLDQARAAAIRQLRQRVVAEPIAELKSEVGVPTAALAIQMVEAISSVAWTS